MGRRHKGMHPRDTKMILPFIDSFMKLVAPSDTTTPSSSLFDSYAAFVATRSIYTQDRVKELATRTRFYRQFSRIALTNRYEITTKPRGYKVRVERDPRIKLDKNIVPKLEQFIAQGAVNRDVAIKFHDKKHGKGLFATREIEKYTPIAEYTGEFISLAKALQREKEYEDDDLDPRIIYLEKGICIDGNRSPDGKLLRDVSINLGGMLNHSHLQPNCQAKKLPNENRCVLYTIVCVPIDAQLVWDYNDRRNGLPDWLSKS